MAVSVEDIAEAIVANLSDAGNADKFPETFSSSWDYVREKPYSEYTTDPEVLVIPQEETNEDEDRGSDRFNFSCGIVVIRKVATSDKATVRPLLALPRAIRDFLQERDMVGSVRENVSIQVLYGHDELKNDATLVTVISAKYWIDQ